MEQNEMPTFEQLIEGARNEDWDFVDKNINDGHLTSERINWAVNTGLSDENNNIRDFAATLLDKSDYPLISDNTEKLKKIMANDLYHIVRYRLAIALYKRGDKSSEVQQMMLEAQNDPDVGDLARKFFK